MHKNNLLGYYSVFICILLIMSAGIKCSNDDDPVSYKTDHIFGKWSQSIPIPDSKDTIIINMTVSSTDTLYFLEILPDSGLVFLQHKGKGNIQNDSIYLSGNPDSCFIIDTTAYPDSLAPLSDSVVQQTIAIPVKFNSDGYWVIPGSSLKPVIAYFPLDEVYIDYIVFNLSK